MARVSTSQILVASLCIASCAPKTEAHAPRAERPSRASEAAEEGTPPVVEAPAASEQTRGRPAASASLLEGDQAFTAGDLKAARRHYEEAARRAGGDPAPWVGLLRVRLAELGVPLDYGARKGDDAVLALLGEANTLAERYPEHAPLLVERGRLLLVLGRADEALSDLRRGAAIAPEDPEAQSALGVALLATGRTAEAVVPFERAAARDPRTAARHTNLGTAYMMASRVEEAIRAFRAAVNLAPNDARTHSDLGTAYLARGRSREALAHLERAVALEPRRATFLSNLGYAYQELGELERAVATCRRAIAVDDRLGSAWINLGTALARLGSLDEAKRAFETASRLDPEDPRARANLEELEQMRQSK